MKLTPAVILVLMTAFVAGQKDCDPCEDEKKEQSARKAGDRAICQYLDNFVKCVIRAQKLVNAKAPQKVPSDSNVPGNLKPKVPSDSNVPGNLQPFQNGSSGSAFTGKGQLKVQGGDTTSWPSVNQDLVGKESVQDSLKNLQSLVDKKGKDHKCDIDVKNIFEEVKKGSSGSTASPIVWLLVMLTSFLAMLQL